MSSRKRNARTALVLILAFAVSQVYLNLALGAALAPVSDRVVPQQISGILTTQGTKPVMVNGTSVPSGTTIMSGEVIETTDDAATITIPGHGYLNIPAHTRLTISWDQNGNIKINIAQGCAVLHTNKGTSGEIDNTQGVVGKTDGSKDGVIDACNFKPAGGGAGPGGTGGGLSSGEKAAIGLAVGGGVATALYFGLRGGNPSRSTP